MTQFYEAFGLDKETHNLITSDKVGLLEGHLCSVCDQPFETDKARDNAILIQANPMIWAHEECWENGKD